MKKLIKHIFAELMDAQKYSDDHGAAKENGTKELYAILANEELEHAKRLVDACDQMVRTSEENFLWDFERERITEWWSKIRAEIG